MILIPILFIFHRLTRWSHFNMNEIMMSKFFYMFKIQVLSETNADDTIAKNGRC